MEGFRNGADFGMHEDDVSCFYRRIGAAVHGSPDIGTGQDRRIIDAVADEHDRTVFLTKFIHLLNLILRQELSPDVVDTGLGCDVIGSLLRITGKHGCRNAQPEIALMASTASSLIVSDTTIRPA